MRLVFAFFVLIAGSSAMAPGMPIAPGMGPGMGIVPGMGMTPGMGMPDRGAMMSSGKSRAVALAKAMANNPNSPLALMKDKASMMLIAEAVKDSVLPDIKKYMSRGPPGQTASPMYERKTQAPLVWIHMRKAPRILVDREFYNISTVGGMEMGKLTQALIPPKGTFTVPVMQKQLAPPRSFLQQKQVSPESLVETKNNPIVIQNGLYLSMGLRQPPQETMNIAAVEDTRTIQGEADYLRKKREARRLEHGVTEIIKQFVTGG